MNVLSTIILCVLFCSVLSCDHYCNINDCAICSSLISSNPGHTICLNTDLIIPEETSGSCLESVFNNVVIDCLGHTLDGGNLIDLPYSSIIVIKSGSSNKNVTIQNCHLANSIGSIRSEYSLSNLNVLNCHIDNVGDNGVKISNAQNVIFQDILVEGSTNTVNVNGLYFGDGINNLFLKNVSVSLNRLAGTGINFVNFNPQNSQIEESSFTNNLFAISVQSSANLNLTRSIFRDNSFNIFEQDNSNIYIWDNIFENGDFIFVVHNSGGVYYSREPYNGTNIIGGDHISGNYYKDLNCKFIDENFYGICNSTYELPGNCGYNDNYPLVYTEINFFTEKPMIIDTNVSFSFQFLCNRMLASQLKYSINSTNYNVSLTESGLLTGRIDLEDVQMDKYLNITIELLDETYSESKQISFSFLVLYHILPLIFKDTNIILPLTKSEDYFEFSVQATGGIRPLIYSINEPGLTINSTTGFISGYLKRETNETVNITITVTDYNNVVNETIYPISIWFFPIDIIDEVDDLVVYSGDKFYQTFYSKGGYLPHQFIEINNDCYSLNSTGHLIGKCLYPNIHTVNLNITVRDHRGFTSSFIFNIDFLIRPLIIQSTEIPDYKSEEEFSYQIIVEGGTPPYNFSLYTPIKDITISNSGVLSGSLKVGSDTKFPIIIKVVDIVGVETSKYFEFLVIAPNAGIVGSNSFESFSITLLIVLLFIAIVIIIILVIIVLILLSKFPKKIGMISNNNQIYKQNTDLKLLEEKKEIKDKK